MKEKTVKINKREMLSKKAQISYLQIFILILSSFAFSYLVYESSKSLDKVELKDSQKEGTISRIIYFILSQIRKPLVQQVSAQSLNCCPKTKLNVSCLDFTSTDCANQCSQACLPTQCNFNANCKFGCCWDSSQGTCDVNVPKVKCDSQGGIWKEGADCNVNKVPECRLGCCVLGNNVEFVSSKRCEVLSSQRNLKTDFRAGINTEGECIALTFNQSIGACMFNDLSCKMMSNNECRSLTGRNIVNALCTASALNSTCKPTNNTMCVEGKDEVYFQDTCGNPGNIYDARQVSNASYWERVVRKENSCGTSSSDGNANDKKCGNCLYFAGSKCKNYNDAKTQKPDFGNYICQDLSCYNAPYVVDALGKVLDKKDRKNGESWCVYDAVIGVDDKNTMSRDTVGSRHYRYSCIDGNVSVEPCADFRNEVCTEQSQFDINGTNVLFSAASCRINAWQSCIEVNTQKGATSDMKSKCTGADCFVKKITIDSGFKFDICVPINKEGFDTKSEGAMKTAEQICGMASQKCTVIYKKKMFGGCECVKNCKCLEAGIFTKQMNELCTSLGDCGGYVNVIGEYTDEGYSTKKVGRLSQAIVNIYKSYAKPIAGQKVDASRSAEVAGQFGFPVAGGGKSGSGGGKSGPNNAVGIGAVGVGAAIGAMYAVSIGSIKYTLMFMYHPGIGFQLSSFGGAAIATGLIVIASNLITSMFGIENPFVNALVSTAIASFLAFVVFAKFTCFDPTSCVITIIIIIINFIMQLFGGGKCPPKIVEYNCMPWQAPSGGADCGKCNSGTDLKPCSKYKCQSLGKACELINEGTGNELCIAKVNDGKAPVISPNYQVLSANFSYMNVSSGGFSVKQSDGRCIEAFTPLVFGINTDKPAQCKIDLTHKLKYDDMENYFGESNLYLYNHSMGFSMPSVELILRCAGNESNLTEADIQKQISTTRIYTRCQDVFGNLNNNEYLIDFCIRPGPDKTAPYIVSTNPASNSNLAYNTTNKEIKIYTNEPASCKWSKQDKDYSAMENSFVNGDECEAGLIGWEHSVVLTNLSLGENTFYFRCRDQPWFEGTANASRMNTNSQSYQYKLRVTETPLTITRIIPNGTIVFGNWPAQIDLIVDTAGGVENGKAWCYYKWGDYWILFFSDIAEFSSLTNTHTQQGVNLPELGAWNLPIKCTDGGNEAYGTATFNLEWDRTAPSIVRIYNSGGSLYLFTNENSECAYSNTNCNFIFTNGTQMTGGFTQEHGAEWNIQKTYYIKCRDAWNNEPNGCSIRVRAYNDFALGF